MKLSATSRTSEAVLLPKKASFGTRARASRKAACSARAAGTSSFAA